MGRYYSIVIGAETATPAGNAAAAPSGNAGATFTNLVNGRCDLGAPQIELDIPVASYATPAGYGSVKIWGVSIQTIMQAADFQGAPISVYGGMQAGLPLATAAAGQAGLLVSGTVYQSFGNWEGINQTLDLVIAADGGAGQATPGAFNFNWKAGTPLSAMIKQVLAQAFPSLKANINISSSLVLPADESGYYQTVQQFAAYLKNVSQDLLGGTYPGVDIILTNGAFEVFDGTSSTEAVLLNFWDLVGQPTWIDAYTVQYNTVMRADLSVGDYIAFPQGVQTLTTGQSQAQVRTGLTTFSGSWRNNFVRHIGNSRAPDGKSWISTFRAVAPGAPQTATNPSATT